METSLILLREVVKLFLMLIMGYVLVKAKLLRSEDSRVVSVIQVYLLTPCMIVNAFQIDVTAQVLKGLAFAFGVSAAVHGLLFLFTAGFRRLFRLDLMEQLSIIYTNAGILVLPLIQAMLGQAYVVYSCGFVVVQLVLLWTHCRVKVSGEGVQWRNALLNVNVLSILLGAALFAARIRLPALLGETVSTVGAMMGPMGMLLAGMIIAEIPLREVFCVPRNYLAAALRLLVCPVLLLAVFRLCRLTALVQDGKNLLLIVYLASVTPACTTLTSIAQLYGRDSQRTSVLYVLTTTLSVATMPLMVGLFSALL